MRYLEQAMIQIHQTDQGSESWLELRRGLYTGSNAHKLLKHGAIDYSLNEGAGTFKGNFHTRRGHILEDEAIELYQKIKNIDVLRPGFVTNTKYPKAGYSPDGLTDSLVIEVKCFAEKKHMQLYNGDIPLEVLAQVYFGMLICEKPAAHLVIYNPSLDPDKYTVKEQFKIIEIKNRRAVMQNFRRILAR